MGAGGGHQREIARRRRTRVDAKELRDLVHSLPVLGGEFPARAERLLDEFERRDPGLGIGREHRRNCGERGILVEQQHVELLAHQRLEDR